MNKVLLYVLILLFPFFLMIIVNEFTRTLADVNPHTHQGIDAINSSARNPTKCSWLCHNETNYCKENHVKIMKPYFKYTDPVYFGIIKALFSTGNYGFANVLILVILLPLAMCVLLVESLQIQHKINGLKQNTND